MKTLDAYRIYLATTAAIQRVGAAGGAIKIVNARAESSDYWRTRVQSAIDSGEVPNLYQFGEMQVYLENWDSELSVLESSYEQREEEQQKFREEFICKFSSLYPDAVVARYPKYGETYIYWEPLEGLGITINVGQALCEKVLVREDVEEVIDPEAFEEFSKTAPKVKKVKPIYEYRCNDAELEVL